MVEKLSRKHPAIEGIKIVTRKIHEVMSTVAR